MKKGLPAFTLIEMSIVLIIVGIIAGFGLPALTNMLFQQKMNQTVKNQEVVLQALAAYVNANNWLPLPHKVPGETRHNVGLVPYKTLGLPESYAKDGFKNWMTYAVEKSLVSNINALSICQARDKKMNLHHPDGRPVFDKPNDLVAVVLISHGPDGHGAFNEAGGRSPVPETRPLEAINADETLNFVTAPYHPDNFQHKVTWVTRNNLMAIYAKNPCIKYQNEAQPPVVNFIPHDPIL